MLLVCTSLLLDANYVRESCAKLVRRECGGYGGIFGLHLCRTVGETQLEIIGIGGREPM